MRISRRHAAKDKELALREFLRRLEAMHGLIDDLKVEVNIMHKQVEMEIERQNDIIEEEGE